MADNYTLHVTAGPSYTSQQPVPVNTETPLRISSDHLTASLTIRIQNFRSASADQPKTSPYFSHPPHEHDLYSLQFRFTLKEPINGNDLVFGNDFDHPIRDKLPPGFQQAFQIVKWFVDPGLYGDVHADEPYLYGPLLSSMNVLRVGPKDDREQEAVEEKRFDREAGAEGEIQVLEEGGETTNGVAAREEAGVPGDAAGRKKYFLDEKHRQNFTFEEGREYENDFFNPYLDFNDFALKLPGFSIVPGITIPIISYWDGQPLRYVMKNRKTDEALMVIVFTLVPKEEKSGAGKTEDENVESKTDQEQWRAEQKAGGDDDVD